MRGTTNRNVRGNARDRAARKRRLLYRDGTGDGVTDEGWALCATCPTVVDFESMTVDCWPVPRCEGGKYGFSVKGDLGTRIQCERCACKQGGQMGTARRRAKKELAA